MNRTSAFQRRVTAVLPGPAGSRVVPIGTACLAVLAALSASGCNGEGEPTLVSETRPLTQARVTGVVQGPEIYTDDETGQTFFAWDGMRSIDRVVGGADLPSVRQIRIETLDEQSLGLEDGYPGRDYMSDDIGVAERWSGLGRVRWQQRTDAGQWQLHTSVSHLTLTVRFLVDRDGDGLTDPAWLPCHEEGDEGDEVCYAVAVTMFNPFPGANPAIEIAGKSNDQPLVEGVTSQEYSADEATLTVRYPQGVLALRTPAIKHVFIPTNHFTDGGVNLICLAAAIDPGLNVSVDQVRAGFASLGIQQWAVATFDPMNGIATHSFPPHALFGVLPNGVSWAENLSFEWSLEFTGPGDITEAIESNSAIQDMGDVFPTPFSDSRCD